jgi:hypothetical protein
VEAIAMRKLRVSGFIMICAGSRGLPVWYEFLRRNVDHS